jgi:hypothetical protein
MLNAALALAIAIQGYWTVRTIAYEWEEPYSGAADAASYLRTSGIWNRELYAIGYACTGIQPYFGRNIFANVNGGRPEAYWDWSDRNHVNELSGHLASLSPEYVIVGYKGAYEQGLWTNQIRQSGYRRVMHFDGHLFWRTEVLEPESFDLYRRPPAAVR